MGDKSAIKSDIFLNSASCPVRGGGGEAGAGVPGRSARQVSQTTFFQPVLVNGVQD